MVIGLSHTSSCTDMRVFCIIFYGVLLYEVLLYLLVLYYLCIWSWLRGRRLTFVDLCETKFLIPSRRSNSTHDKECSTCTPRSTVSDPPSLIRGRGYRSPKGQNCQNKYPLSNHKNFYHCQKKTILKSTKSIVKKTNILISTKEYCQKKHSQVDKKVLSNCHTCHIQK